VVTAASLPTASTAVGSGSMTLELGRWEGEPMQFVPQVGRNSARIEVEADDTLSSLRDKINAADAGLTASLVSDSTGVRLSLRSSETGEENAFRVQVSDNDGTPNNATGLSRFAYDPANNTTGTELKRAAGNAQAVVNGIPVSSANNEISGAVEGLTFKLRKENFGTAEVAVSSDTDAVKKAIQAFAESYNELAKNINEQTRFDPTSRQGGPLQGDSAVGSIQRQLRNLVNTASGASSSFGRLSDLGLQMQRDGTINVNSTKLEAALSNPTEVKKAFSNLDAANSANNGFARRYVELATQVLGSDGTLTTRTQGLQKQLSQNSEAQARLNDRVDRFQQRLVQQYTALDGNLARLNALSSSVTQQLNRLNPSGNNSG
jgi:flagellar hook-associated protein 2